MEKSINIYKIIKKVFNKDVIKQKLFHDDIATVLKRSQLYSSSDFADTFLSSAKEK